MQRVVDDCPRGYQTKAGIVTLLGHLDRYAYEIDVISKMYSQVITVRDLDVPDSDRQPFTPEERKKLWDRRADPRVQVVLIYIFTGWRLMELLNMRPEDIDLEAWTMKGGEKTKSGKNRVVPIWTGIRPFASTRTSGTRLWKSWAWFTRRMKHGTPLKPCWIIQAWTRSAKTCSWGISPKMLVPACTRTRH